MKLSNNAHIQIDKRAHGNVIRPKESPLLVQKGESFRRQFGNHRSPLNDHARLLYSCFGGDILPGWNGNSVAVSVRATTVWEKSQNTKYLPGDFAAISFMRCFAFARPSVVSSHKASLSMDPEKMSNLEICSISTSLESGTDPIWINGRKGEYRMFQLQF